MSTAGNGNVHARLRCHCGRACARRSSTSVQNMGKFYFNCANAEIPGARYCDVKVWEMELEDYVRRRHATAVEQAEYHQKRHDEVRSDYFESVDELDEAQTKICKLNKMNKVLQYSLAATAPVAATIVVASAWIAKCLFVQLFSRVSG